MQREKMIKSSKKIEQVTESMKSKVKSKNVRYADTAANCKLNAHWEKKHGRRSAAPKLSADTKGPLKNRAARYELQPASARWRTRARLRGPEPRARSTTVTPSETSPGGDGGPSTRQRTTPPPHAVQRYSSGGVKHTTPRREEKKEKKTAQRTIKTHSLTGLAGGKNEYNAIIPYKY